MQSCSDSQEIMISECRLVSSNSQQVVHRDYKMWARSAETESGKQSPICHSPVGTKSMIFK